MQVKALYRVARAAVVRALQPYRVVVLHTNGQHWATHAAWGYKGALAWAGCYNGAAAQAGQVRVCLRGFGVVAAVLPC